MNLENVKFRGICIKTGKWVYGTGVTDFLNCYPKDDMFCLWSDYSWKEIDRNTFGQLLPVKDKNGGDIYSGDYLDFDPAEWGSNELVNYPEMITLENLVDWSLSGSTDDISEWRAVVGSVYQNPEILEVSK